MQGFYFNIASKIDFILIFYFDIAFEGSLEILYTMNHKEHVDLLLSSDFRNPLVHPVTDSFSNV